MWTWFLVFLVLVIPAILVWRAKTSPSLRGGIESFLRSVSLLGAEDGLFDTHKPYTWMVQWVQWASIPTAVMIVLPTHIIMDAGVGLVLAVIFYIAAKFFTKKWPANPTSSS